MNLNNVILVLALVVQVKCDCDDYFKCLSGFVGSYLGDNINKSDNNNTTELDFDNLNKTVGYFDLSDIAKSLSQALTDVTTFIKDQLKGVFDIDDQTDVHKDIKNKTEIHVRAFKLSKDHENNTLDNISNETKTVKIPEVIMNNLTKFNDELNALKAEIEKNLQAELESFISQILENDTVDWIELTENSFSGADYSTTEQPYPDFENEIEITTQNDITVDTENFNISTANELNKNISTVKIQKNERVEDNENISSTTATNINTTRTTTETAKMIISSFSVVTTSVKSTSNNIASTEVLPKVVTKNVPSIKTSTVIAEPINITTTSTPSTTEKTTNKALTKTPKKQESPTKTSHKRLENVEENEVSHDDPSYYDIHDDNATDYPIIDYVELYKDTTNEDVDYKPTVTPLIESKSELDNEIQNGDELSNTDNGIYTNVTNSPSSIFPWIAVIFIKNNTNDQFDYYCDGSLLSNTVVLTTARCLLRSNQTVNADDIIIFLGKRSLQTSGDGESIHKVKELTLHSNFSLREGVADSDLAVLYLEDQAVFSERIQPACLLGIENDGDAVTTAWGERLSLIKFEDKNKTCEGNTVENTFCATYGLSVALCPSFGGAYAVQQSSNWCLAGLRSADPSKRGLCFDKTVRYTDLRANQPWIESVLK